MRLLLVVLPAFLPCLPAQTWYPKHNLTFGLGAGNPQSELKSYFDTKVGTHVGYGYRFHRFFQADIGFDTIFGAGNVREFVDTFIGPRRVRDYQYMVPFGGRAIAPLFGGRLEIQGGGGGAYLRYSERISQPDDYYRLDCPVCTARSGWGYYATAGLVVALDRYQRFRIGVSPRVYRGHTKGDPLGAVPGVRTKDHWVNVTAELGISF
jgi:hypothetical protein